MRKTKPLKLNLEQLQRPYQENHTRLVKPQKTQSEQLKRETKIKKGLDELHEQCIIKFQNYVEDGGDTSKDKFYKNKSKPYKIIGFDTEDDSKGNVHLLIFYDGLEYFVFNDKDTALYWLYTSYFGDYDVLLWAVNTQYDLTNTNDFINRPYLVDMILNKSNFVFGQLYLKQNIKFYDVVNFYSLSTLKVGELFGMNKLGFDFTKRKYRKDGSVIVSKKEIEYCKRDTKIAYMAGKFIMSKFDEYDIRRSPTVASCTLQIYLKHYSPTDFTQFNANRNFIDKNDLYNSYCGGRTEAFRIGEIKGSIKYYDINSLYPYIMKTFKFPDVFSAIRKTNDIDGVENGMIKCTVKAPDTYLPILPLKYNITGKKGDYRLLFPKGIFKGCFTIPEIYYAMENGYEIIDIDYIIEYEKTIDLFSTFVNDMYNKRMKSKDDYESYMYKIFMNSLYGKFAEKRRQTHFIPIEDASLFDPIVFDKAKVVKEFYPSHNYTIIPSYVTSLARIELHKRMTYVLDSGYELLYCDTDSIIYKGSKKLWKDSKELGGVKIEDTIKYIKILGAKYYMYENNQGYKKYVCKGVPKANQKDMFDYGKTTYRKPLKLKEAMRRKRDDYVPNFWIEYHKESKTDYNKRNVLEDGNTTSLEMDFLEDLQVII